MLIDQRSMLDLIASGASLAESLDAIARLVESQAPEMHCSILVTDEAETHLRHGAAPSLPAEYNAAVDGEPIGPVAGSCGTAAFRRELVVVADIASDPLWENYRDTALRHGLRACWSHPVISHDDKLLGTLALYYRQPREPTPRELEL
ncbi:MAG: GAF domain-containing protein, partial [Gammaproteobacteria bacterium]|nr:GAF domain-containing protein [Gammaproteobacteria bacterium]